MDPESQEPLLQTPREHKWLKWVPLVAVCITVYSALFSTFVLYPWHQELSREFAELSRKVELCTPQ